MFKCKSRVKKKEITFNDFCRIVNCVKEPKKMFWSERNEKLAIHKIDTLLVLLSICTNNLPSIIPMCNKL